MKSLFFLLGLAASIATLSASTIYVQYSGTGTGSGSIDAIPFSDLDWTLEFGVDTTAVDSRPDDPQYGNFPSAITSGALRLGATTYVLDQASTSGTLSLWNLTSSDRGAIDANPASGGYASFYTSVAAMNPAIFTNPDNLGSLISGGSVSNAAVGDGNGSSLSFSYDDNPHFGYDDRLITTTGSKIELSAFAVAGSGNMTMTISDISLAAVPEPLSTGAALGLFGFLLIFLRQRAVHSRTRAASIGA